MRIIHRPDPITINGPSGTQAITFDAFIRDTLCDPRFGVDLASIKLARAILDALETPALPHRPLEFTLHDNEWSALVSVLEKPSRGYDPRLAVHMISFFDAVLDANERPAQLREAINDWLAEQRNGILSESV